MYQYELVNVKDYWEQVDVILRKEHWPELGHYKDIPIHMEWGRYFAMQENGNLRCYIVKSPTNEEFKTYELIGYAFYIVDTHLHYRTTKVAMQDVLYIRKPHRGFGRDFINWCDQRLKEDGVVTVCHHVKPWYDFGGMLEKLGYERAETIWSRRL